MCWRSDDPCRTSGDSPINALIAAAENGKAGGCTGGTEGSL